MKPGGSFRQVLCSNNNGSSRFVAQSLAFISEDENPVDEI
jgi:hypothetical protein